jgi:DNA-binding CsgD family transcriptional regulator
MVERAVLTAREAELLIRLSRGLSNCEIAHQMSITVGTTRHLHRIFRKLNVRNRTSAVAGPPAASSEFATFAAVTRCGRSPSAVGLRFRRIFDAAEAHVTFDGRRSQSMHAGATSGDCSHRLNKTNIAKPHYARLRVAMHNFG